MRTTPRATVAFVVVFLLATFAFNFNVLFPLLANRTLHRGAGTFGLIAAVFGAGAFTGAMINAFRAVASVGTILVGAFGFGVLELVLAPLHSLLGVCALLYLTGIFYVLWGTNALTTLQLAAPPRLRGRASSLYFFAFQGGAPIGGFLAGLLVAWRGTELAYLFGGAVAVTAAVWGTWFLSGHVDRRDLPAGSVASAAHAFCTRPSGAGTWTSAEEIAELTAVQAVDEPSS